MSHCWFSWQGCPSQLHCGQQHSVPHWSSLVKRAPVWPWGPSPEEDLHHSAWKGLLQKAVISDVEKSLLWILSSHDIWPISAQRSAVNFYYSSDLAASLIYRNNAHSISFFWSGGQKYNSTHMFVFLGLGISQIQKLIHRFTGFKARRNHENIWYDFLYFKAIQLQPISPVPSPVALLHLPEKHPAPDILRYGNVNTSEVGDSPPCLILKLTVIKKCASFLIRFCLASRLAISFAPFSTL